MFKSGSGSSPSRQQNYTPGHTTNKLLRNVPKNKELASNIDGTAGEVQSSFGPDGLIQHTTGHPERPGVDASRGVRARSHPL